MFADSGRLTFNVEYNGIVLSTSPKANFSDCYNLCKSSQGTPEANSIFRLISSHQQGGTFNKSLNATSGIMLYETEKLIISN
jgi:hypothetical protein